MKYRHRAYIYLILAAAIWGAAGPVIKYTLGGIDPIPFLAYRLLISGTIGVFFFLYKIFILKKKFHYLKKHLPLGIFYGLLAVPLALGILFFALDNATVLDLTLIGTVGPLMVTAGGAIFFKDRITHKEKVGISVVVMGVLINSLLPLLTSGKVIQFSGNILLLLFLFIDSGSMLVAKRAVKNKIKSSNLTNLAFIVGAVILIPIALTNHENGGFLETIKNLPLKYHLGVWYMALFSGNLGYYLYVQGQKSIEASEAILFNYLQPVFMVPLAVFWLGEKIDIYFVLGAILIIAGVYLAEHKKSKRKVD